MGGWGVCGWCGWFKDGCVGAGGHGGSAEDEVGAEEGKKSWRMLVRGSRYHDMTGDVYIGFLRAEAGHH